MSDNFQHDVFLSHNKADKARVRQLAERLRSAGMRIWFDEWRGQFTPEFILLSSNQ